MGPCVRSKKTEKRQKKKQPPTIAVKRKGRKNKRRKSKIQKATETSARNRGGWRGTAISDTLSQIGMT